MTHSISLATMGKFAGPAPRKMVTGNPPYEEVTPHKFPEAEVTKIETEDLNIKVNLIRDDEEYND